MFKSKKKSLEKRNFSFLEFESKDPEHLSSFEQEAYANEIEVFLGSICKESDNSYSKFYHFEGKNYFTSSVDSLNLSAIKLKKKDPIEVFFDKDKFLSNASFGKDYVKVNGYYFRFCFIKKYPQKLGFSEFQEYGNYFCILSKIGAKRAKALLETKRRLNNSHAHTEIRNIESDNAEIEAEDMLQDIVTGEVNLFNLETWFVLKSESESDLSEMTEDLILKLEQREIDVLIEDIGLTNAFLNFIPENGPNFLRKSVLPSNYMVNVIPLRRCSVHRTGIPLLSCLGKQVFFNQFEDTPNFNVCITGQSGSGKSFLAQRIQKYAVENNIKYFGLETGNSCEKFIHYYEGNYFEREFNPMQFRSPFFLKEFILAFIPASEVSIKDHGKIFKSVSMGLDSGITNFKDLIFYVEKNISEISYYFEDSWNYFTDKNIELNDISYANTEFYPEKLQAPLMIYLMEYLSHLDGKKIFVFDEIWNQLANNGAYLSRYFRLGRKNGISNIAISQLISDFLDHPNQTQQSPGRVIAGLCHFKIFFNQEVIENEFLGTEDVEKVKNLSRHQFYLKTPEIRKICHLDPTPFELELFSSDHFQNLRFKEFYNKYHKFLSYQDLFHHWVGLNHNFESFLKEDQ